MTIILMLDDLLGTYNASGCWFLSSSGMDPEVYSSFLSPSSHIFTTGSCRDTPILVYNGALNWPCLARQYHFNDPVPKVLYAKQRSWTHKATVRIFTHHGYDINCTIWHPNGRPSVQQIKNSNPRELVRYLSLPSTSFSRGHDFSRFFIDLNTPFHEVFPWNSHWFFIESVTRQLWTHSYLFTSQAFWNRLKSIVHWNLIEAKLPIQLAATFLGKDQSDCCT